MALRTVGGSLLALGASAGVASAGTDSPSVTTHEASAASAHSATLNGEIVDLNASAEAAVFFEYGVSEDGAEFDARTEGQTQASVGTFSETVDDLEANTEYAFRAVAETDGERTVGEVKTFVTGTLEVATVEVEIENETAATLTGELEVLDASAEAEVFFEYDADPADGEFDARTGGKATATVGTFSETVDDLEANIEYAFRAVAETDDERTTGDVESFVTASL